MPHLRIQLLGDFCLWNGDSVVTGLNQPRLQSLLAYLLLHRRAPHARQQLAFLFWPDSNEEQALTNLRKQLLFLRRALPEADRFLYASARSVQWHEDALFTLDVAEFEQAVEQAVSVTGEAAISALQAAVNLYRGDLLPVCYDDWIAPKREELRGKYIQALERLVLLLEDRRDYPAAIQAGQRLLRADPLHETTYRRLMRLYALNGDRAAALQVYQTCVTVLQGELGVEPGAETRDAYERLLQQEIPVVLRRQPSRLAVARPPFVGRQPEWQTLQETWRSVGRGHAHFVLISGEAGIGKTRLAEEMLDWAERQRITTARTRTYAAEGRLAYAPAIEWLRTPAVKTHLNKLEPVWLSELARLLPELLTEHPSLPPPNPVTESWQRHRLFEALARALLADRQPLLLVIDDLQWCDQETLEWLHFLLRYDPQAPLLIVGTARPEEIGPKHPLAALLFGLRTNHQLTRLDLKPLDAAETAQLAQQMVGLPFSADLAAHLYRATEGNPLFIVETVRAKTQEQEFGIGERKAMAADHSLTPDPQPLPPKVQVVIEARLAQLSPLARKLAALAAVIGRDFTFDVLVLACDHTEDELVNGIDELSQRHVVRERGANGYDFSHDKLREVVYEGISATRRRLFHRRIAQALETVYTENLDEVSSQLAAHWENAGMPAQAVPYYQRAAQGALRVYANHEAIDHFQRGLALLAGLPDCVDKDRQELSLLLGLGPALVATHGYGFARVREIYTRAQVLTQQLSDPANPAILRALALFWVVHRDYVQSYALGEQILTLAYQTPGQADPLLYVEGHYVLGVTAFWLGKFLKAQEYLEQAVAAYDVRRHEAHAVLYAQDPGAICLVRLALTLWYLGYPGQAQQKCEEALALARELAHPFTLDYVLTYAAWLHYDRRDQAQIQAFADEVVGHARRSGRPYWLPIGLVLQGRLLAEQGQIEAGIIQIRSGMSAYQTMQFDLFRPYCLAMLAQTYAKAGAIEQGLAALDEALATVDHQDDRWYEAELQRLKGELLAMIGTAASVVEACFQQAHALARQQQAKSLELRAAMSLSRLWCRQGKREQARQLLAETYGWFTEGFDTADLQEAKALLAELS